MSCILAGIECLWQHLEHLAVQPGAYRPQCCARCGKAGLWAHGVYWRKPDREGEGGAGQSLNPVAIPRFLCPGCRHTCSVLPECIPPRRWYQWKVQQQVLVLVLAGASIEQISMQVRPCARTVWRWWSHLRERFAVHAFHLRNRFPELGLGQEAVSFWQGCLRRMTLAQAMFRLHQAEVTIP